VKVWLQGPFAPGIQSFVELSACLRLTLAVSFWNRLRPPVLYWPDLRFDELPGLLPIVCGHGYDNGVVLCCRRYLRSVDSLSHRSDSSPTFPLPSLPKQIPVQFKRYGGFLTFGLPLVCA
jgi:hypothetical protein